MADVATPSGAAMFDAGSSGHKRPEVPDQAVYEAALKQAEKEHAEATAKYVSHGSFMCIGDWPSHNDYLH